MKTKNIALSGLLTGLIVSITACGGGGSGGGSGTVAKQNNLPQIACSASFGGGRESSGTISYNPSLSPTTLGYLNQFIYYDNRPSAISYLVIDYWDDSGNWNGGGSIVKPTPVYGITGGTGSTSIYVPPANQWPSDVCSYMGSTERYTSNLLVVPLTENPGIMAWKNCSASITNGVMTFNANYEFYLNSLNTAPVESGTVTFTCNNIKDGMATPQNSTSARISQTISDVGMYDYLNSLRDKYAKILK